MDNKICADRSTRVLALAAFILTAITTVNDMRSGMMGDSSPYIFTIFYLILLIMLRKNKRHGVDFGVICTILSAIVAVIKVSMRGLMYLPYIIGTIRIVLPEILVIIGLVRFIKQCKKHIKNVEKSFVYGSGKDELRFCAGCGAELDGGDFCAKCGMRAE